MLSNFQHKIIGSTLHHISAYWELLNRAHNIANRDRWLATSFIAYRHRSNHIVLHRVLKIADRRFTSSITSLISQLLPCSFIYGRYLGSDMLLKSHHKVIGSTLYRISTYREWLHHVLKIADCADYRSPISHDIYRTSALQESYCVTSGA